MIKYWLAYSSSSKDAKFSIQPSRPSPYFMLFRYSQRYSLDLIDFPAALEESWDQHAITKVCHFHSIVID